MKTDLTIGIPTYNQGEYLEETLESILSQTKMPDQIVISNNYSNDQLTEKVLKKYSNHSLIKIIKPNKFLKMCENWHFTAINCNTKFFTLISSDDIMESNFVEDFINSVNDKADFYRFNFNLIDNKGHFLGRQTLRSVPKLQKYPSNFLNQLLGPKAGFPAFVISRKLYDEVGGYDKNLNFYADWHLLLKVAERTSFYHIDTISTNYRTNYREGLRYLRAKNGGIDDIIFIHKFLLKKFSEKKFNKYIFYLNSSILIHMSSFLLLLEKNDKLEIDKVNNFLKQNNIKAIKSEKILNFRRFIVRIFEFYLKFFR
mgnify:CR=1 FL=1